MPKKKKMSKGLLIGIIVGLIIGVIAAIMVFIGMGMVAPHKESILISLISAFITFLIIVGLCTLLGHLYKKHRFITIFGSIGILLQLIIIFFNPSPKDSTFLYWLFFPGVIIIICFIIGFIVGNVIGKK